MRYGIVVFFFALRLGLLVGFILAFLLGIFVVHPKIVFAVFDFMAERHARTYIALVGYSKTALASELATLGHTLSNLSSPGSQSRLP